MASTDARWRLGNHVAPPRFILFCVMFAIGLVVAIPSLGPGRGTMAAFDAASALFLVSIVPLLRNADAETMRAAAKRNDANRAGLLALTGLVMVVILVAVAGELHAKADGATIGLVIGTLALAWLFSNMIYAEVIGAGEPQADVELLALADQLLKELGITEGVTLQLNTLGDSETREAWRQALVAHFETHRGDLSEDSQARLDKNPLRILDSKDPRDRPIADAAPDIDAHLTSEAGAYFEAVTKGLDAAGVAWTRNSRLVRGLDYYRHTAFEFVTDRLGAQGTVLGGGRYDGLMESLGGPHTPAVGWAAGVERLAMLVAEPEVQSADISVLVENDDQTGLAISVITALRQAGYSAQLFAAGAVKKRYEKAVRGNPDLLCRVERSENGQPHLNVHVYAKYPHSRYDEEHLAGVLSPIAAVRLNVRVRETWAEMKVRHASDADTPGA